MRKSLSYLIETELDKASILLAAKAITDKLQQMAEQIAKMDANDVMPLGDSMRDLFGAEEASAFEKGVSEKLRGLTEQVREAKNAISDQIDALESGQPMTDLGAVDSTEDMFPEDGEQMGDQAADLGMGDQAGDQAADLGGEQMGDQGDDLGDLDDVFGGDPMGAAGRPQKESVRNAKKVLEGASADHRLAKQFAGLLREGKSPRDAAQQIAETYAMDVSTVVGIITKVKKG
jgi:hypothetical protein